MRNQPTQRRAQGATLIETMIAMAVFSVGIVGIMQMNVLASGQNHLARRQVTATQIGSDLVNMFDRLPFNHPALASSGMSYSSTGFMPATPKAGTDGKFSESGVRDLESTWPGNSRPLTSLAEAIAKSDGYVPGSTPGRIYRVGWRVSEERDASGQIESKYILIMVRFRVPPADSWKQLNFWTVKYAPDAVIAPNSRIEEI